MTDLNPQLAGVLPVFQVPFKDDLSVDHETLRGELNWIIDQQIDGIVFAMVSEVLRLSDAERNEVTEAACEVARNRDVSVVISVGAESTHQATKFAAHAEAQGATAVMAIPPLATNPLEDELLHYYGTIVDRTTLPVIVQDAGGYLGQPMTIEAQARIAREFPGRIMFKPEAPPIGQRLTELRTATNGKALALEGTGGIGLVDNYRRGIVGTMPGADLCWAIVAIWEALEAGDDERADEIHAPLGALIALQTDFDAFLAVEKHLLKRQGVVRNTLVRGPVGFVLDEDTLNEVDRRFDQLRELVQ